MLIVFDKPSDPWVCHAYGFPVFFRNPDDGGSSLACSSDDEGSSLCFSSDDDGGIILRCSSEYD
jgi:hypothetical protein